MYVANPALQLSFPDIDSSQVGASTQKIIWKKKHLVIIYAFNITM